MLVATKDGWNYVETKPKWRVCPFEEHVTDCPSGQYWNELSCQCFIMIKCKMGCPEGSELIPTGTCSCVPTIDIRAKLYPDWATDEDISASNAAGIDNYSNPYGYWPVCDASLTCGAEFYLNELACKCFSLA